MCVCVCVCVCVYVCVCVCVSDPHSYHHHPRSFGKKLAHSKEQEAASQHVSSGAGKNDEPIGYCSLSLNEMLEKSASGAGVKLIHPKGKDKACGSIFFRLKAVPRLTEDEIASGLQARAAVGLMMW